MMNLLENICKKNGLCFQISLLENVYCKLSLDGRKIECPYLGKKDKNGFYSCSLDKKEFFSECLN